MSRPHAVPNQPQAAPDPAVNGFLESLSDEDRGLLIEAELLSKEARIEAQRAALNHEALFCSLQRKYRTGAAAE